MKQVESPTETYSPKKKEIRFETHVKNAKELYLEGDNHYQKEEFERAIIFWEKSAIAWENARDSAQNKEYKAKSISGLERVRKNLKRAHLQSQNKGAKLENDKANDFHKRKEYEKAIEKWNSASVLWKKCLELEHERTLESERLEDFFENVKSNIEKINVNIEKTKVIQLEDEGILIIEEAEKLASDNLFDEAISKLIEAKRILINAKNNAEKGNFKEEGESINKLIRNITMKRGGYQKESERLLDLEFMEKDDIIQTDKVNTLDFEISNLPLEEKGAIYSIENVKTKRQIENLGGNIHYKVLIENHDESMIFDVRCQLEPPKDAFITFEEKDNWQFIQPGETKPFEFILHPCYCGKTNVGGWVFYKDSKGKQHPVEVKEFEIQIKCPLIVPEIIENIAVAEKILTFINRDQRKYSIYSDPNLIFTEVINVLQMHDSHAILIDDKNFKAYFSAKSKLDENETIIMKLEIIEEDRINGKLKFLVLTIGCKDEKKLIGLLAKINDEIKYKIDVLNLPLLTPHLLESCNQCGADLKNIPRTGEIIKCDYCKSKFYYLSPGIMQIIESSKNKKP